MIPDKLLQMRKVPTLLGVKLQTLRNWSNEGYIQDRLVRFGVDLIREMLHSFGTELVIVNQVKSDYKQEIIDDMIAIIVHFSSHLYGKHRGKKKTTQIKQILKNTEK